ncbi:PrpF protein-domain-containing protein [Aspergillus heterothallicus]
MISQDLCIQKRPERHVLPCVLMRAGTSKGIFLHRKDLPINEKDWAPHLISALGSRGNDPRQIDGVGGGTSTTSKVAVVSHSQRTDADIDWTFVQVAVGKESIDLTGNCGNMTAGVAPFAIQEGLVHPQPGQTKMDVRIYNTNTKRLVIETVALDSSGDFDETGDYTIAGVNSPGSEVKCTFVEPIGSMTGKLFPSNNQQQQFLHIHSTDIPPFNVRVTLIDSANPFVLMDTTSISTIVNNITSDADADTLVEIIRREAAVAMGLAPNVKVAAQTRGTPKVALVYPPTSDSRDSNADIRIQAYSMGLPHPSLQLTGAVTVAVALSYPGTIVAELASTSGRRAPPTPERTPPPPGEEDEKSAANLEREVRIAHSKGVIKVGVVMNKDGRVASCAVSRTARRLFEGRIRYYV